MTSTVSELKETRHGPLICSFCGAVFDEETSLKKHAASCTRGANCLVCFQAGAPLTKCSGHRCSVVVHAQCLGMRILRKPWLCQCCRQSWKERDRRCVLCPNTGGMLVQTSGGELAHLSCCLWAGGSIIGRNARKEIEANITRTIVYEEPCCFCKNDAGAQVACMICAKHCHVTCSQKAQFRLSLIALQKYASWNCDQLCAALKQTKAGGVAAIIGKFRKMQVDGVAMGELTVSDMRKVLQLSKTELSRLRSFVTRVQKLKIGLKEREFQTLRSVWVLCPSHSTVPISVPTFLDLWTKCYDEDEESDNAQLSDAIVSSEIYKNGDDGTAEIPCLGCGSLSDERNFLLCDNSVPGVGRCHNGAHVYCLDPPLTKVPDGSWSCPVCEAARQRPAGEAPPKTLSLVKDRCVCCQSRFYRSELQAIRCDTHACLTLAHMECLMKVKVIPTPTRENPLDLSDFKWECPFCIRSRGEEPKDYKLPTAKELFARGKTGPSYRIKHLRIETSTGTRPVALTTGATESDAVTTAALAPMAPAIVTDAVDSSSTIPTTTAPTLVATAVTDTESDAKAADSLTLDEGPSEDTLSQEIVLPKGDLSLQPTADVLMTDATIVAPEKTDEQMTAVVSKKKKQTEAASSDGVSEDGIVLASQIAIDPDLVDVEMSEQKTAVELEKEKKAIEEKEKEKEKEKSLPRVVYNKETLDAALAKCALLSHNKMAQMCLSKIFKAMEGEQKHADGAGQTLSKELRSWFIKRTTSVQKQLVPVLLKELQFEGFLKQCIDSRLASEHLFAADDVVFVLLSVVQCMSKPALLVDDSSDSYSEDASRGLWKEAVVECIRALAAGRHAHVVPKAMAELSTSVVSSLLEANRLLEVERTLVASSIVTFPAIGSVDFQPLLFGTEADGFAKKKQLEQKYGVALSIPQSAAGKQKYLRIRSTKQKTAIDASLEIGALVSELTHSHSVAAAQKSAAQSTSQTPVLGPVSGGMPLAVAGMGPMQAQAANLYGAPPPVASGGVVPVGVVPVNGHVVPGHVAAGRPPYGYPPQGAGPSPYGAPPVGGYAPAHAIRGPHASVHSAMPSVPTRYGGPVSARDRRLEQGLWKTTAPVTTTVPVAVASATGGPLQTGASAASSGPPSQQPMGAGSMAPRRKGELAMRETAWVKVRTKSDSEGNGGETYYWNRDTNETTWAEPSGGYAAQIGSDDFVPMPTDTSTTELEVSGTEALATDSSSTAVGGIPNGGKTVIDGNTDAVLQKVAEERDSRMPVAEAASTSKSVETGEIRSLAEKSRSSSRTKLPAARRRSHSRSRSRERRPHPFHYY